VQHIRHTCRTSDTRAAHQTHVQNIRHTCRTSDTRAEHQTHVRNIKHTSSTSETRAEHQTHVQHIRHTCRTSNTRAAHQTHVQNIRHTCAMIHSLSQKPVIKMTFQSHGGALGPTRCVIPKIEVLGDRSITYLRVTLYRGYLTVLSIFHLVCILYCGCLNWFCDVWVWVCVCVCVGFVICVCVCGRGGL